MGLSPRSRTSGASTVKRSKGHQHVRAGDEVLIDGVDLRAALGVHGDRQAHVRRLLTLDFGDRVRRTVVLFDDLDDGGAERSIVTAEHLDLEVGRELQRRLVGAAHSQNRFSSSRMRAQTPPSKTFVRTMTGLLSNGAPSNEMLTSPTAVPRVSGAASCASTSIFAASFG